MSIMTVLGTMKATVLPVPGGARRRTLSVSFMWISLFFSLPTRNSVPSKPTRSRLDMASMSFSVAHRVSPKMFGVVSSPSVRGAIIMIGVTVAVTHDPSTRPVFHRAMEASSCPGMTAETAAEKYHTQ